MESVTALIEEFRLFSIIVVIKVVTAVIATSSWSDLSRIVLSSPINDFSVALFTPPAEEIITYGFDVEYTNE